MDAKEEELQKKIQALAENLLHKKPKMSKDEAIEIIVNDLKKNPPPFTNDPTGWGFENLKKYVAETLEKSWKK